MPEDMTFEDMHAGTIPGILKADGSRWRIWIKERMAYCKRVDGPTLQETPFKLPVEEAAELFDADLPE
jgi:hypothetical protein